MPRLDWYAFYVADYRADTRHLTPMQHFAYREILDEIFLAGQHESPPSIPDDDDYLRGICRPNSPEEWQRTRFVLIDGPRAMLDVQDGKIYQKRMAHEVEKAIARSGKAKAASNGRWNRPQGANGSKPDVGHGGNGHGQKKADFEHLSRKQYIYLASRISKWRGDVVNLYAGASDNSSFEDAFKAEFGMSWKAWNDEISYQSGESDA